MDRRLRFRATAYRGGLSQPAHEHDHVQISLVLRGRLRERVGAHDVEAGPLSLVVKDAGVRHADVFGPERVMIAQLALPHGTLAAIADPGQPLQPWLWQHRSDAVRPFLRLVARAARGPEEFTTDDFDVADLIASLQSARNAAPRGTAPRWLAEAVDQLRSEWRAGLRVGSIAERLGVHPVYLARCFRRWYGRSVGEELRRLRQHEARAAVVRGDETLSTIAHRLGYADEAHLNREFRRLHGVAPGHFRRDLRRLPYREPTASMAEAAAAAHRTA